MCDDKSRYTAKNKLSNKSQESKLQVLAETSHRKGKKTTGALQGPFVPRTSY